jgi:hypothetical protein
VAEQEHTECYSWLSFKVQNVISRAVRIARGQREFRGLLRRRGNCCSTNNTNCAKQPSVRLFRLRASVI